MTINELLEQKSITKYRLSKTSGIPFATISDISTGKSRIEKCAADTVYKLAKALDVTMEDLVSERTEYRMSFEAFKSTICHQVKDMGDMEFIIDVLESDKIRKLYEKKWYPESLYLLAMVDYLSRENDLPLCTRYDDLRAARLCDIIYPASAIVRAEFSHSEKPKQESWEQAIPEFKRFNIVEAEVRNVF